MRAKGGQYAQLSRAAQQINISMSRKQKCEIQINSDKKNNLRTMLKFMPLIDRHYCESLGISEN